MPLGYERLNERSQRPNACINFIKPLDGPDKAIAEDYLNRIAAQCYPVMKAAHISVMALEEFPPNNEFLGRNFNAGECIQLVLKDKSGRWLGFKFVQMVMMHELAHCKQMNHSKYFWQVRNQYAAEMYELWNKKYLGEGVWGRGQDLGSGQFVLDREVDASQVPEHLCGGTYRRRGRKRKRGANGNASDAPKPTYAERQQRRIAKKFGKHGEGNTLGEDELVRDALEASHRRQGKPRVAGSKRGRELRAQAALARFQADQTTKATDPAFTASTDDDSDVEWSDSETDDEVMPGDGGFVKVCTDEDDQDEGAQNEMAELQNMSNSEKTRDSTFSQQPKTPNTAIDRSVSTNKSSTKAQGSLPMQDVQAVEQRRIPAKQPTQRIELLAPADEHRKSTEVLVHSKGSTAAAGMCTACSLENEPGALICMACANVLRPGLVKGTWRCQSETCRSTKYLNPGDVGRCGICGISKLPTVPTIPTKPISADVLRWD